MTPKSTQMAPGRVWDPHRLRDPYLHEPRMEPKGPQRTSKDPPKHTLKTRSKKGSQKDPRTEICLSIGTGSAFIWLKTSKLVGESV